MSKSNKASLLALKNLPHDFVRVTGSPVALWQRPRILYDGTGARRKIRGGALLIANHTGFFDPVYMMLAVPYRRQFFIVSEEVMDKPLGTLLRACRCIRIDRQNPNLATFREIIARLKSGEVISMFPEAHINRDAAGSFQSGMVLMAVRSGVPIVPMYIKPKQKPSDRLTVVLGERVSVTELYGDRPTFAQIDASTRLLYEREAKLAELLRD